MNRDRSYEYAIIKVDGPSFDKLFVTQRIWNDNTKQYIGWQTIYLNDKSQKRIKRKDELSIFRVENNGSCSVPRQHLKRLLSNLQSDTRKFNGTITFMTRRQFLTEHFDKAL